nr:hypothetical protein [Tanacetum cinerariifolium]
MEDVAVVKRSGHTVVTPKRVRCSNAGNGVERRWPALLHRRPALPNGVGFGVGR